MALSIGSTVGTAWDMVVLIAAIILLLIATDDARKTKSNILFQKRNFISQLLYQK
jgi:hypothetical protein